MRDGAGLHEHGLDAQQAAHQTPVFQGHGAHVLDQELNGHLRKLLGDHQDDTKQQHTLLVTRAPPPPPIRTSLSDGVTHPWRHPDVVSPNEPTLPM